MLVFPTFFLVLNRSTPTRPPPADPL